MIVVDVGCYDWGGHMPSLPTLARKYKPSMIYGFDPCSLLDEGVTEIEGVPAVLSRKAVWIYDGEVPYTDYGSGEGPYHPIGGVGNHVGEGANVPCLDFSAWLHELAKTGEKIVVKMDIEHAEVPVLERLIETDADLLIDELLIEWHGDDSPLPRLRCRVRDWWM